VCEVLFVALDLRVWSLVELPIHLLNDRYTDFTRIARQE
jgi:hypothetical protein